MTTSKNSSTRSPPTSSAVARYSGLVAISSGSKPSTSVAGYLLEVHCSAGSIQLPKGAATSGGALLLDSTGKFQFDHVFDEAGQDSAATLGFVVRSPNGLPCRILSENASIASPGSAPELVLKIAAHEPFLLEPAQGLAASQRTLKGKVVDRSGAPLKNKQLILYGRRKGDSGQQADVPLATVTTHSSGAFSVRVPNERFTAACATASVAPGKPCEIALDEEGRLPDFTLLVVEGLYSGPSAEDDCACHDPTPRLPGQEELVDAESRYSQDIGGACVNFTIPNRTLEEFSYHAIVRTTDPRGEVTPMAVDPESWPEFDSSSQDPQALRRYQERTLRQTLRRKHQIRWDDKEQGYELYQAVTIAHGHVLTYKQVFKADGYSMGDLLYSLPLAPGQKKQVVIYDWNRTDEALRAEKLSAEDSLEASISRDRDVKGIVSGTMAESVKGGSEARTSGWSVSGGASVPLGAAAISVGGGYSSGRSSARAWQDSSREFATSMSDQLRDRTMQSASSLRSQRSTVVTAARQGERMSVTSEVVANHNHCHALTIQYFEVLRHFVVEQELVDVRECLFIPLTMTRFDDEKIVRWKECLLRWLKAPRERLPALRKGFEIIERRLEEARRSPRTSYFQLVNAGRSRSSAHVLDVDGATSADGARLIVHPTNHGHNQQFCLEHLGGNDYRLRARHSNKCVALRDSLVVQEQLRADPAQVWVMENAGQGLLRFKSRSTGHYLSAAAAASSNQVLVQAAPATGSSDWRLIALEFAEAPGVDRKNYSFAKEPIREYWGEFRITLNISRPEDAADGALVPANWAGLLLYSHTHDPMALAALFQGRTLEQKNEFFEKKVAPEIATHLINALKVEAQLGEGVFQDLELDCTLVSSYGKGATVSVSVRPRVRALSQQVKGGSAGALAGGTPTELAREQLKALRISLPIDPAKAKVKALFEGGTLHYRTDNFRGALFSSSSVRNDLGQGDAVLIHTPLSSEELRNPYAEEDALAQALRDHLNHENLEYYHHVLWCYGISADRRFMMLDRIHLDNPDFTSTYAARGVLGRSIASLVENRIVAIVGNCLVMPVAPGYNLDPTYKVGDADEPGAGSFASLLEHYRPLSETDGDYAVRFRLSVPTPGVFAEAVRGACNACEKIDDTRYWRWEQSPIDEPTAIEPVSTDSRYQAPPDTRPQGFANPIINIQNTPTAPAPASLDTAMELLGKASPFGNLTGLDRTQQSAAEALRVSAQSASAFADKALQLRLAELNQRNLQKTFDAIDSAYPPGEFSERNRQLKDEAIRASLGQGGASGGGASQAEQSSEDQALSAIGERIQGASSADRLSYSRTHADGSSVSVSAEGVRSDSSGEELEWDSLNQIRDSAAIVLTTAPDDPRVTVARIIPGSVSNPRDNTGQAASINLSYVNGVLRNTRCWVLRNGRFELFNEHNAMPAEDIAYRRHRRQLLNFLEEQSRSPNSSERFVLDTCRALWRNPNGHFFVDYRISDADGSSGTTPANGSQAQVIQGGPFMSPPSGFNWPGTPSGLVNTRFEDFEGVFYQQFNVGLWFRNSLFPQSTSTPGSSLQPQPVRGAIPGSAWAAEVAMVFQGLPGAPPDFTAQNLITIRNEKQVVYKPGHTFADAGNALISDPNGNPVYLHTRGSFFTLDPNTGSGFISGPPPTIRALQPGSFSLRLARLFRTQATNSSCLVQNVDLTDGALQLRGGMMNIIQFQSFTPNTRDNGATGQAQLLLNGQQVTVNYTNPPLLRI
jgi:hypothetical protein